MVHQSWRRTIRSSWCSCWLSLGSNSRSFRRASRSHDLRRFLGNTFLSNRSSIGSSPCSSILAWLFYYVCNRVVEEMRLMFAHKRKIEGKSLTISSIESWNAFGAPNRSIKALKVPRPAVKVDLAHHVRSWAAAIRGNAAIRKWVVPLNGIFQYVEILARGTPTNATPIPKLSLCPMKQKHETFRSVPRF